MEKDGASAQFTDDESDDGDNGPEESKEISAKEKRIRKKIRDSIEAKAVEDGDIYTVLGLEAITFEADEDTIRRAYQKVALHRHPDKVKKGEYNE